MSQDLTWSMTQTAKLDITRADPRGLVIGLNEFAGYLGLALAGVATGYAAALLGTRAGLLCFGTAVIGLATVVAWLAVAETLPWAQAEVKGRGAATVLPGLPARCPSGVAERPTTGQLFALMSWQDRRMAALCQAGLVEKFVDALVWGFWPVYLHRQGMSLPGLGWIVGLYGFTWGGAQCFTGRLSDRVGRHRHNVWGMWVRGLGAAAALGGRIQSASWFVAIAMGVSGAVLQHWGEETHPRLNPAG